MIRERPHHYATHWLIIRYQRHLKWAGRSSAALLRAAESQFDALITTDRNLRYQQNIVGYRLSILILPTTNWPLIRAHQAQIAAAVNKLRPGDLLELSFT